jgi:hypothetical protein
MRRSVSALTVVFVAVPGCKTGPPPPVESLQVLSETYVIDRKYQSMQGPSSTVELTVLPGEEPELVWITGFRAEAVEPDGATRVPPEFLCHSNLSYDAARHRELFGWSKRTANRLFTLSQGQSGVDLPEGFGIPVMSNEMLTLTTQVLNHNVPDTLMHVRVRVTLDYVRDRNLAQPFKPLYMKAANALVSLDGENAAYGAAHAMHGGGSSEGTAASGRVIRDRLGREFAGHWIVPPGRQENKTLVTNWMNLPGDATAHYIAVHVHPFAESLTLTDLTAGETVFASTMTGFPDRIGLQQVTSFAGAKGIDLPAAHEYQLTSVYDNTSGEMQEAMAVMYMYLLDEKFTKPDFQR